MRWSRFAIGALAVAAAVAAALAVGARDESSGRDDGRPVADERGRASERVRVSPDPERELSVSSAGWSTDFTRHTVPLDEFASGGPPKDGIPAIDRPRFVPAREAAEWLDDREPVIEVMLGGEHRAYPLQILVWHEIVNDRLGGVPVAVTFCPLCNAALVFDRRVGGRVLDFGTTGNLRLSDLVMYDQQTETWWQQFGGEAIVGALAGRTLRLIPAGIVAFGDFAARDARGAVLSRETGHDRPYGRNPYAGYDDVDSPPIFTAGPEDGRLPPKERVVFVEWRGQALAVAFGHLRRARTVRTRLGGERIEIVWRPGVRSALDADRIASGRDVGFARVTSLDGGGPVPFDTPFWFAVAAFRPDVRVVGASAG